jgi:asparagine synthase (glutamine-hydrolysing)
VCGICGLASLDGATPVDAHSLAAMNATLVHRGPDSGGNFTDGPVGLAARRLAIVDVAGGDQPVSNEDGRITVVHNGEIYNAAGLRAELEGRGHRFATRCDTEVLVHLYEEEGPRFLRRLRGMFAVALWDAGVQRLLIARDPFGIKPLYWSLQAGQLAFASELKALRRAPGFSTEIDLDAVEAFLAFNSIPGPRTIFASAHKLGAGHRLLWNAGAAAPVVERFADPRPVPAERVRSEPFDVLAGELRERLRDSVRAHLIADVGVGVLLSGGVDSAALAALAAQETSGGRVSTFSIGFRERSFDELPLARLVAERYDTDHHELVVDPDAAELLPAIVAAFDEPFADSSALPTYLVSQLAAEHVKVALSGEGGDELFGGYETYVADLLAARVGGAVRLLAPVVARLPSSSGRVSFDYKAKRFVRAAHLPPLERHHAWKEIFSDEARTELLRPNRRGEADPLAPYRERWAASVGAEPLARLQDLDRGVYLVDDLLVKTDRMSMAHSLETRVPFLDSVVAELAHALPTAYKVQGTVKKRLLRAAVAPLVPTEIARARKRGFSIPAAAWLRSELVPFAREVLSPERIARQGLLRPQAVTAVLDAHVAREADLSRQLWGLMTLSLWLDGVGA